MDDNGAVKLPAVGQVGIVVKDLDKIIEYYSSTFGIGPWRVIEVDRPEVMLRGQKYPYRARYAFANLGPVELELIEVISGRSIHSEFLEEGREGLHHLGFFLAREEKERILAKLSDQGINVTWGSGYLDTERMGGVIFELIHVFPNER